MNQQTSTELSASANVSPDAISRRAYELWESEGRPEGCDQRHWLQAEQELAGSTKNNLAGSSARVATSAPTPARNSDVTPLQGTRAAAAAGASANANAKRGTSSGTPVQDKNGNGAAQNGAKRKPAAAPAL